VQLNRQGAERTALTPRKSAAIIAARTSVRETAHELPNAGQDGLLIAGENPMIGSIELDEARLRDVAGEIPASADADGTIATPVKHQCWHGNSIQKMANIRIA
jgi:hypothetical protein